MSLTLNVGAWLEEPAIQEQVGLLQDASSLSQMVCIALQLGLGLARALLESELDQRGKEPSAWSTCESCGKRLHSKGLQKRQMQTLVGQIA